MRNTEHILTLLFFLFLYFPVFPKLVREWAASDDFSHGFFIPFISFYFIWRKKDELKKIALAHCGTGILITALGLALYIGAVLGYQFFLQAFSMLVVLFGLVYTHAGREIAKKTAFAIFFLVFMIPFPQIVHSNVSFQLRLMSTKLAFFALKVLGINATREGNIIHLPTCSLIVANPCSGLRSLITFMAASLAIGYIFQKKLSKRVFLFLFSILLAVMMNMLRLVSTAFIADMKKYTEIPQALHDGAGLLAIILGFAILFTVNNLIKER